MLLIIDVHLLTLVDMLIRVDQVKVYDVLQQFDDQMDQELKEKINQSKILNMNLMMILFEDENVL